MFPEVYFGTLGTLLRIITSASGFHMWLKETKVISRGRRLVTSRMTSSFRLTADLLLLLFPFCSRFCSRCILIAFV